MNFDNKIKRMLGTTKKFGGKNDWDGDGVPNRRDCQPRNTMRQDRAYYARYEQLKKYIKNINFSISWTYVYEKRRTVIVDYKNRYDDTGQDKTVNLKKYVKQLYGEDFRNFEFKTHKYAGLIINIIEITLIEPN